MRSLALRLARQLGRGGKGAFRIEDVPDLSVYLKHTTGTYQDNAMTIPAAVGDPVGGWRDQAGGDWNPVSIADGNRPTLQATGLQFVSASVGYLSTANWNYPAAFTFVFRYSKTIAGNAILYTRDGGGNYITAQGSQVYWATVDEVTTHSANAAITDDGNFHTIIARKSLTTKNVRFDGSQIINATVTLGSTGELMNSIGRYSAPVMSDMYLKYFLIFTRYITDAEAANIESFLAG